MLKLDLGGAVQNNVEHKEYLTVDINPKADVVLDFEDENLRFPFGDNSVDEIRAFHILEHIHNIFGLMNECHRILKPTGSMYIVVPKFPEGTATVDPTHIRMMVPEQFHYFSRKLAYMGYTDKFWFMNLSEAINLNVTIGDVYFRIEFIPDKHEEEEAERATTIIRDAVIEDMFDGPNWDGASSEVSYRRLIRAIAVNSLYNRGLPVKRYKEDGEECGQLAGKKMPWKELGFYDAQQEQILKLYDPPPEKVIEEVLESPDVVEAEVVEEAPLVEVVDDVDKCFTCGSEVILVQVDQLEKTVLTKLLAVYPDALGKHVCPNCLGEDYVDSFKA